MASLREAHTLMEWCQARNVNLGTLRMCGNHFDPETRRVKASVRYLKWSGLLRGVGTALLLIGGIASLQLISVPQVLLSIKSSGQYFLASEAGVRGVWPPLYGPVLTSKSCLDVPAAAQRMSFTPEDTQVMCDLLGTSEFKDYVAKALSNQRQGLAFLGVFLLVAMYFVGVSALHCACALKLLRRGVNPDLPAAQQEFDFSAAR